MKLVVTGGAGYIGSVVTSQLLEAGHDVTVVDDLSTGHADAVPDGAAFVQARIHDIHDILADVRPDGLLHFAAKSLVGESVEKPELYWENNVVGTFRLLEAVRQNNVPRMVFSSTAAVYGEPSTPLITEDLTPNPINAYGRSKLAIDMALTDYAKAHGLAATSLRYFNVGGARGKYGERHAIETHLIPNILKVPAGERDHVYLFGQDYPTPDGTCVRDYLHVVDLGRAHLLALDTSEPGTHRIFNLGSGTGFSVKEVLEAARAVTGHPIPAEVRDRRPGDPATLVASSAKAKEILGWEPEYEINRIVSDAWEFIQSRM
ncbi:UDP-glucose 4-epimerase GalE [Dermatophilus congolensis]|uniref:UDP-glucose 4-epimerase GalE n=1 Tax=Dermatophilus congolensis TaxID=1863 RepID=UPI001AAF00DB|nr:UDP-glucose 4-epimerase GalE [Dermatophilus congolensis]MBO3142863.1 UDP-glucose 4-epimerase GalE [Dermatophilus congolensis]MBO3151855.1 UDP-glucose 4-epimerase GalE [Dermatophilus congolensis]MBO3161141.1 UDP-glucose 4-epimerase GalE [Dermatophilus congolensis]MBO3163138.1 UDP-glucose 4-epimerase GalE [Dermatophilus congolensis]MBO3176693.1 UDP-glucose 4-epimerase GalE [Dermatophilus congolensis]